MHYVDLKKKIIRPSSPKHSLHERFRRFESAKSWRRHWRRMVVAGVASLLCFVVLGQEFSQNDRQYLEFYANNQSQVQQIRVRSLSRFNPLPLEKEDPKYQVLVQYLNDKKSPLASYAGILSRLPNWRLLLGISQAESNMCKRTDRNNCWGIGPGSPFAYGDISESLYHANDLLTKYGAQGMKKPETIVRTYVGYENPNWVAAVHDVMFELSERGLQ